jgi:hypothetical protein
MTGIAAIPFVFHGNAGVCRKSISSGCPLFVRLFVMDYSLFKSEIILACMRI